MKCHLLRRVETLLKKDDSMRMLPVVVLLTSLAAATWAAPSATPSATSAPAAPPAKVPAGWANTLDKEVPLTPSGTVIPLCFNLWDGPAPGQIMDAPPPAPEADDGTGRIRNVSIPGILVYLPPTDKIHDSTPPNGNPCIISCMGGSYDHLTRLVGADNTVSLLVPKGIAVVSLKYRLKPISKDVETDAVADGKRAVRFVRAHAKEWGIDPAKVGMMGWSAGGNLILSLCTHLDQDGAGDPQAKDPVERESCRPDFVTLLSPWPNAKPITAYPAPKAEPGKSKGLPPAFMGNAEDDRTAPFTFAKSIQSSWEEAGDKVEFYDIATGGHGAFELLTGTAKDWPDRWFPWMEKIGMWKKE